MKKGVRIILICVSSLLLISWDKTSKNLAKEHLEYKAPVSYLHDTFRLEYAENTGAAMSIGDTLPAALSFWLLGILPLAVLAALFVYMVRSGKQNSLPHLAAGILILSGGIGNISDRLFNNRYVIDFMNIGLYSIRSGIFNFADMYITAGAVLLLITSFNKKQITALQDKRRWY